MSEPRDPTNWTPPRTWLLKQIRAVIAKHVALTVDGWDEGGHRASCPEFAAQRAEFRTRLATAEVIASLVTIAVRGIAPNITADRLADQTWRANGIRARRGPAIVAAIIAGYEPLPDKFGPGCGFRQRVSS